MDIEIQTRFSFLWQKYFEGAELPITIELGKDNGTAMRAPAPKGQKCLVGEIMRVREGTSVVYDQDTFPCEMGKYLLGYESKVDPKLLRNYLASGIPGKVEGQRLKRTPKLVDEIFSHRALLPLKSNSLTFKRWDQLTSEDNPYVAVFFSKPDVLSGLLALINFNQVDPNGAICPFVTGCMSILLYSWFEQQKESPKAVLGMFNPSERPLVGADILTMAIPMKKLAQMIDYIEESFLITEKWNVVKKRIAKSNAIHSL